jgi:Fur family ferric uptake transcriptional regulator
MESLKAKLNAHQLKATPTRIDVLKLMQQYDGAIPFSFLQKKLTNTDRITLFRTLNALLDSGLVHKANFENDETYYAQCPKVCSSEGHIHNHIHFKCTVCEIVSCRQLPQGVKIEMPDLLVQKIDINVLGICSDCQ